MRRLGFREYLAPERQSDIITSFRYPEDPAFDFAEFYRRLAAQGMVIYPGKVSHADCFRIGTIGQIFPEQVEALVSGIEKVLGQMGIKMPPRSHQREISKASRTFLRDSSGVARQSRRTSLIPAA